ncbi:glycosyltransferase family 4 protein [Segatella copri]|uniref:glycosyltransferase family 4 protein n=1 Tax=Segatella copri TaxID=165179 RepID=UPI002939A4EF|nr:glycosyltransferase family 4 protein [Segatella copri]MDV3113765.1 glycosyltransferase family 4 protein [Segatella copri]WOF86295.1 glycosyltransferase family 4 protein [Segatella copri]WOF92624.1 glycosyltransferase family 4 protein [Segatella copri]WOG30670.1 glycosyltransferase family 4 protein [Segatella copri]
MLKNIVVVNDFAKADGGAGKVAIDVALALSKHYVVYFFSSVPPIDPRLQESNVCVICMNKPDVLHDGNRLRAIIQGLWDKKVSNRFAELLAKLDSRETVVHVHTWTKALTSSIFSITSKMNFHLILTLHDFFLFCPNGGFFNYKSMAICEKRSRSLRCLATNCDSRNYYQKIWRMLRLEIQNRHLWKNEKMTLLYISKMCYEVSKPCISKNVRMLYLPDPVDLPHSDTCDIEKNEYYLYLGRLSPEKGAELFCKALSDIGLKGVLVGDGYLMENLKCKYPNMVFAGWASGDRKAALMRKAKALIFPSYWRETYGLAVAEARSYGIPCIVPDKCAASEQVVDGKTGYIFKTGDLASLKEAVLKYEHTDLKQMQKNLIESFHPEELSMETHVKKLIEIYNDILSDDK